MSRHAAAAPLRLACPVPALLLPAVAGRRLAAAARGGEPAVQRKVTEDDGVRIEELRVRGETQRIVVRSKVGGARPTRSCRPAWAATCRRTSAPSASASGPC
jgi:hypothetical protein